MFTVHVEAPPRGSDSLPEVRLHGASRRWRFGLAGVGRIRRTPPASEADSDEWEQVGGADEANAYGVPITQPSRGGAGSSTDLTADRLALNVAAARAASRARLAAAERAAAAEERLVRAPCADVVQQLIRRGRVSRERLVSAYELGQLDAITAAEIRLGRVAQQAPTPVGADGVRLTSEYYAVLLAPARDIDSPRATRSKATYRVWVAPRDLKPEIRGPIVFSPAAVSRGLASATELAAYFAGAGLPATPALQ